MNKKDIINEIVALKSYYQELDDIANGTFVYDKENLPLDESSLFAYKRDSDICLSNAILYIKAPQYSNFQKYLSIAFNCNYNKEETKEWVLTHYGKCLNIPACERVAYIIRFLCLAERIGKNYPDTGIIFLMDKINFDISSAILAKLYLNKNVEFNNHSRITKGLYENHVNSIISDFYDYGFQDNEINEFIECKDYMRDSLDSLSLQDNVSGIEAFVYIIKLAIDEVQGIMHQQEYNMIDEWYKIININEEEAKARLLNISPDIFGNLLGITDRANNESKNNVFPSSEKADVDEWFGEIDEFFDDYMKIKQLAERLSEEGYIDKSSVGTFILRVSGYQTNNKVTYEYDIRWRGEDRDLYFLHKLLLGRFEGFTSYKNGSIDWKYGKLKDYFKGPDFIDCHLKCNRCSKEMKSILEDIFGLTISFTGNKGNISIRKPEESKE